ncbi:uncharacterized protein LOC142636950 [Castanea sativa]|uniref:uncharacterized protein LOC142636950 n=1 Tax=Castanea sativa TaxID=21020 RepID=UPI003F650EA0
MVKAQHAEEKMPLRKGAWTPEEDKKLTAYIKRYGIWNWSQMPKPADLARSGKSCRLRWMNYLRPDIKRGNFSKEEEETILKCHEELGNRWSAIAAKLPGRTDNEIKNYWHTNLKKRLRNNWSTSSTTASLTVQNRDVEANQNDSSGINLLHCDASKVSNLDGNHPMSPQLSTDDPSTSSTDPAAEIDRNQSIEENVCLSETFEELQSFWEQPFSLEDLCMVETDTAGFIAQTTKTCFPEPIYPCISYEDVHHDLWLNLPNQEEMHGM